MFSDSLEIISSGNNKYHEIANFLNIVNQSSSSQKNQNISNKDILNNSFKIISDSLEIIDSVNKNWYTFTEEVSFN